MECLWLCDCGDVVVDLWSVCGCVTGYVVVNLCSGCVPVVVCFFISGVFVVVQASGRSSVKCAASASRSNTA